MRSAVEQALSHERGSDIIEGVKNAVAREFETLDPAAEIETTEYFNHSYVPDLVVRWNEGGRWEERSVFLRFTLRAAALGGDVRALGSTGPIVLTLREDDDELARQSIRREVADSPALLVTDVPALDEAASVGNTRQGSPLLSLVRANIVRGARGLLDSEVVGQLAESAAPTAPTDDEHGNELSLQRFASLVEALFLSDAATRLQRAANLVKIGLSEDANQLIISEGEDSLIGGRLSDAELRVLLPYLLAAPEITESRVYWSYIGSMMDLDRLETMASNLSDIDLTPLVAANLNSWSASRASLTWWADGEDTREDERATGWRIHAGILSLGIGNWRLHLAHDGRKLRGRTDSLMARWDDLSGALQNFELARVSLRGVVRTVDVEAERDSNVRSDVVTIRESIEDDFLVPVAEVRDPASDSAATIEADFTKMLAMASTRVSLRALARVALELLGHRYPVSDEERGQFA
jgi:hypothetical protein